MSGPIDFIIVSFKGNQFDGSILIALSEAIDSGAIALRALTLIVKDADGTVSEVDIMDDGNHPLVAFAQKHPGDPSIVGQDDLEEMAELLEPDTAAGLLIIEHLWAKPLKQAIMDAGGTLVAEGRIHKDAAKELVNA